MRWMSSTSLNIRLSDKWICFQILLDYSSVFQRLSPLKSTCLAAARSHSGENNAPCCFLRPSCRYATRGGRLNQPPLVAFTLAKRAYRIVDGYHRLLRTVEDAGPYRVERQTSNMQQTITLHFAFCTSRRPLGARPAGPYTSALAISLALN